MSGCKCAGSDGFGCESAGVCGCIQTGGLLKGLDIVWSLVARVAAGLG
jgi:hypothetical protein